MLAMEALHQPLNLLPSSASSSSSSSSLPFLHHHPSSSTRPIVALCNTPSSFSSSSSSLGSLRTSNALTFKLPTIHTSSTGRRAVVIMRGNAASGYAAALAEVARAQNILEGINTDMEKLGRFLQDKQLMEFLTNPIIKDENKKSIIKSLSEEAQFQPYTTNLLTLLVDKKRIGLVKEVVKEFEEIYNQLTDTEIAIVTSAVKINTDQLAEIAKKIQSMSGAKNVRMKNLIDSSLIAGFIVRFGKDGSRLIDMSVKGQLDRIAQQIDLSQETGVVGV